MRAAAGSLTHWAEALRLLVGAPSAGLPGIAGVFGGAAAVAEPAALGGNHWEAPTERSNDDQALAMAGCLASGVISFWPAAPAWISTLRGLAASATGIVTVSTPWS